MDHLASTKLAPTKGNLTQHIVEELGASIVAYEYPPTQRALTEREVCSEFEVSRSIAREALSMLASKGLIAPNMSQGTWVQPEESWNLMDKDILRWLYLSRLSATTMRELIQVRQGIEPHSAAYAVSRADEPTMIVLSALLDDLSGHIGSGVANKRKECDKQAVRVGYNQSRKSITDIRIAIHTAILDASGNKAFKQFTNLIEVSIRASHRLMPSKAQHQSELIQTYQTLVDAVRHTSSIKARNAMKEILRLENAAISADAKP